MPRPARSATGDPPRPTSAPRARVDSGATTDSEATRAPRATRARVELTARLTTPESETRSAAPPATQATTSRSTARAPDTRRSVWCCPATPTRMRPATHQASTAPTTTTSTVAATTCGGRGHTPGGRSDTPPTCHRGRRAQTARNMIVPTITPRVAIALASTAMTRRTSSRVAPAARIAASRRSRPEDPTRAHSRASRTTGSASRPWQTRHRARARRRAAGRGRGRRLASRARGQPGSRSPAPQEPWRVRRTRPSAGAAVGRRDLPSPPAVRPRPTSGSSHSHDLVDVEQTVAQHDLAVRPGGDTRVVGDEDDGQALLGGDVGDELHDRLTGP